MQRKAQLSQHQNDTWTESIRTESTPKLVYLLKKNKDVLSATSANNCWLTKQGVNQLRPVQTMKKERGKFRSQLLSGGRLAARVLECVFERVLENDLESLGKPLGERLWERIKYDRFVPQTNRHCYLFIVWV